MSARNKYLLKRFGITDAQFNDLLEKQGGACAVCKRPAIHWKSKLAVDHDHKSGEIRGLLCTYCNRWIVGRHRKEMGADLLQAAYEYLISEYPGWIVPPRVKKRKRRVKSIRKNRRKICLSRD